MSLRVGRIRLLEPGPQSSQGDARALEISNPLKAQRGWATHTLSVEEALATTRGRASEPKEATNDTIHQVHDHFVEGDDDVVAAREHRSPPSEELLELVKK